MFDTYSLLSRLSAAPAPSALKPQMPSVGAGATYGMPGASMFGRRSGLTGYFSDGNANVQPTGSPMRGGFTLPAVQNSYGAAGNSSGNPFTLSTSPFARMFGQGAGGGAGQIRSLLDQLRMP